MIIPKAKKLTDAQRSEVDSIVEQFGCSILEITGVNRCVYAILGDETQKLMFNRILGLDYVARVDFIESSYKLVDRKSALSDHEINLKTNWFNMATSVIGLMAAQKMLPKTGIPRQFNSIMKWAGLDKMVRM